ncbi:MAG: SDR family NAD(P)-dependent oxidoreductase, partial [Tagaea sp.]
MEKVAVLTGAGKGMGGACARELAARGWKVALLSPSGNAEKLAAELGGVGVTGSVVETADLQRLVDAAMGKWGRMDGVVTSTGHPPKGDLLSRDEAAWNAWLALGILDVVNLERLVNTFMDKLCLGA